MGEALFRVKALPKTLQPKFGSWFEQEEAEPAETEGIGSVFTGQQASPAE